ncbi:hypothetical protein ACP0BI_03110 [Metamycoplasma hominis]|uniref:hypothetical protein n=1 Tax=Metamycoplasma hominis TaxID=2098 RepID=UPI00037C7492|nr:hypothetical protein [Metamycoplasma hominis]AIU34033.1 hypothetical protein MLBD4_01570 [Metamycoplasma hominis ATCC 27545]QKX31398.1 hypothetical protein HU152_01700 [Metamycoplasma hominis]
MQQEAKLNNDYSKLFNSYKNQIKNLNNLNIENKFLKQRILKIINNEINDFKKVGNKIIKTLLNAYKQNNNAFTGQKNFASFFNEF